ncbi:hypothetical protein COLO4_27393 [Corchorus olitorius]|uniref:Uncharacterized protein n=1 Tax=Corchorus olitorius TaxID=93759 RepID=A0A1R3HRD9_9ROSI|nr:hypothetical protein COLO4_27393 [Corchorus olitorius]
MVYALLLKEGKKGKPRKETGDEARMSAMIDHLQRLG